MTGSSLTTSVRMASTGLQATTYAVAAVYTHSTPTHHDVCGFYAFVALFSLLSLAMNILEEIKKRSAEKIQSE